MWEDIIEYLKDPLLVIKVQNFFGVIYKNISTEESSEVIYSERLEKESEEFDIKQHKRIPSNLSSSSQSSYDTDTSGESTGKDEVVCHISNKFWYWLFVLGTALGDEIFYATFIPFWFWNIDGAVGRRVVLVWTIVMYIGQGFKDIIRWPRPGYPVKKLQQKWAIEYGMPSTHAMVGVSIPFSVLLYTMDRYQYPVHWGVVIAVSWCTLICVSRVYLGMHSVLDIAAGLLLSSALLVLLIPLVDWLDGILLTARYSPIFILAISILVVVYHPHADKWTPTRWMLSAWETKRPRVRRKGEKPAENAGGIEEHRLLHLSPERSVTESQSPQMTRESDRDYPVCRNDYRYNFGRQTISHVGHLVSQVIINIGVFK